MQIQYGGAEQQQKEQKLRLKKENLFFDSQIWYFYCNIIIFILSI